MTYIQGSNHLNALHYERSTKFEIAL